MKKLFRTPFHVFLLPLFPTLALISYNIRELFPYQILTSIGYVLFFVLVLWFVLDVAILKNILKSSLILSLAFFIFRPFSNIDFLNGNIPPIQLLIIYKDPILWLAGFSLVCAIILRFVKINVSKATLLFNIFAVSFVAVPLFIILRAEGDRIRYAFLRLQPPHYQEKNVKTSNLPDIYYIISDRYANGQTLSDYYSFDNSSFITALRNRGFYVADNSAANYPFTEPSLASSLNFNYLDDLYNKMSKNSDDMTPILNLLENNEAIRYLKSRGYKYYHFGAEWVTSTNNNADYQFTYKQQTLNETALELIALNQIPSNYLGQYLHNHSYGLTGFLLSLPQANANYRIEQLLELTKIVSQPGPKFVFVHSLLTHDPYVFDKNGLFYNRHATNIKGYNNYLYLSQLQFANTLWLTVIDSIIQSSKTPPIIIFQSDEGPYPQRFRANLDNFNWHRATTEEIRKKIRILNSYYLPGKPTDTLYPSISPVNTFRVVLNLYLGENLPLLPDKNFAQTNLNKPYDVFDVTNIVK